MPENNNGRSVGSVLGIAALSIGAWELGKYMMAQRTGDNELAQAETSHEIDQDSRMAGLRSRMEAMERDHRRYIRGGD